MIRFPRTRTIILIGCMVYGSTGLRAQEDATAREKSVELESVRTQIRDLQSGIRAAQDESDKLLRDIQSSEREAVQSMERLDEIEVEIDGRVVRLAELNVEMSDHEKSLFEEQDLMAQQVRAAYKAGRNDYLKLLLNQEDPDLIGRMLVYYDYYNRARSDRINAISKSIEEINRIRDNIQTQKEKLDQLRNEQLRKLEEFTQLRNSRKQQITQLQNYIDTQGKQLQILQKNEHEIENLFNELQQQESLVKNFEESPPFNTLLGKLKWPVSGKISSRYGALKKGGKLKWQGVMINADSGADVRAISAGKVVFADWFRNLGLLIIIDHGNGYMSLYGHNERLLKKVGDWVLADENIAKVGDTGGQIRPSLYFEIRSEGSPVNPGLWCKS